MFVQLLFSLAVLLQSIAVCMLFSASGGYVGMVVVFCCVFVAVETGWLAVYVLRCRLCFGVCGNICVARSESAAMAWLCLAM